MAEALALLGVALAALSLGYVAGRASVRAALRSALTGAPLAAWTPRAADALDDGTRIVWGIHEHSTWKPLTEHDPALCGCGAIRYAEHWYYPERGLREAMMAVVERVTPFEVLRGRYCIVCGLTLPRGLTWDEHEASDLHAAAADRG